MPDILYENIKKLRLERGMSQDELAKKTGYTDRSSIAKIEKGLVDLQSTKVQTFANALGVSPAELMGIDNVDKQYYVDPATAEIAQKIFENKEMRALFDAVDDIAPDDLEAVYNIALALKRKERFEDD